MKTLASRALEKPGTLFQGEALDQHQQRDRAGRRHALLLHPAAGGGRRELAPTEPLHERSKFRLR